MRNGRPDFKRNREFSFIRLPGRMLIGYYQILRPPRSYYHNGATATGASEAWESKGHHNVALTVSVPNVDPSIDSFTVVVECSPDGTVWTALTREDGSQVELTASDLDSEGEGYAMVRGAIASELRVSITDYSDASGGDLAIDMWLTLGGWEGPSANV